MKRIPVPLLIVIMTAFAVMMYYQNGLHMQCPYCREIKSGFDAMSGDMIISLPDDYILVHSDNLYVEITQHQGDRNIPVRSPPVSSLFSFHDDLLKTI